MYKVFINNKEINFLPEKPADYCIEALYADKNIFSSLYKVLEEFALSSVHSVLIIYGDLPERLFIRLASYFIIVEAAGGIVKNKDSDILFIFRNNKWDLPKGKTEADESPEVSAIREVKEECGISEIALNKFISHTYHIYKNELSKYVLKRTWWFEMFASKNQSLSPQTEEGIEKVKWVDKTELFEIQKNTYSSLQYLLENYLNK